MAQIKIISNNEVLKTDVVTARQIKKQWVNAKETGIGMDNVVEIDDCCFSLKDIRWVSLKDTAGDSKEKASEKKERENAEYYKKMDEEYYAEKKRLLAMTPDERSKLVNYFKFGYVCEKGIGFDEATKDLKVGELSAIDYVISQQKRYFEKYPDEQLISRNFALKIIKELK